MTALTRRLAVLLLPLLAISWSGPALADDWTLRIASWNLKDFGDKKGGTNPVADRSALLDFMAGQIAAYDIAFVQEIEGTGASFTQALATRPKLQGKYNCQTVSLPSGRGGPERYGVCYTIVAPAAGGTLTLVATSDPMGPLMPTFTAVGGFQETAQDVWMRPPFSAHFTYTPPPNKGAPFSFWIATGHLKPEYAKTRPPGLPADRKKAVDSVWNELTATETNLVPAAGPWGLMGDLNADCTYYSAAKERTGGNFQNGWTWYIKRGRRTNVLAKKSCAYDRIIFNDDLNDVKLSHDVETQGIDQELDGYLVSDHYLVWVEIGKKDNPAPVLLASSSVVVTQASAQGHFTAPATPPAPSSSVQINGANVSLPVPTASANLYVVRYDKTKFRSGHDSSRLVDVRGQATPVTVGADGRFQANAVWTNPVPGTYSLLLDANRDGIFDKFGGDIANAVNAIDFIVEGGPVHSTLASLDDDGLQRELFSENRALNIYALARGLTPGAGVRVYVVSRQLLPDQGQGQGRRLVPGLDLASVSVPVNFTDGPIGPAPLAATLKFKAATVAPDGSLFLSAWPAPYRLFNTGYLDAPLPEPVSDPPNPSGDDDLDPCDAAWDSTDPNLRAACNVMPFFSDHYGNAFSLVVDRDADGVFDDTDLVDFHDVGDMTAYFADGSRTVLDSSANGNAAVGEYKEYLNAKLSLQTPLSSSNIFDSATAVASEQYLCSSELSRDAFGSIVVTGARDGFEVLDQAAYQRAKTFTTGRYAYVDAVIDGASVPANASVCVTGDDLAINGVTVADGASVVVRSNETSMSGSSVLDGFLSIFSRGFSSRELEIRLPAGPPDPTRSAMSWQPKDEL